MYSKHKDALPGETIAKIQNILKELGLETTYKLLKNTDGIYSAYLMDPKCGWHVNGKGTTEEYCMASAYGECMERLQAYFVYNRLDDAPPQPGDEYLMYPDEKTVPITECREKYPVIYEKLREVYALEENRDSRTVTNETLDDFLSRYFMDSMVTVPYYDAYENRIVYLPEQIISAICGSNGLSAGNTPYEALNQGIAEILERHVKEIIFKNGYTPPEVPRDYIRDKMPELYETITEIESMGPYTIVIKDASLGIGMPVIGALFTDRENQRYHAKFGSSFSIQIAIERCLTELFQGFALKNPASHESLMTPWNVANSADWENPKNRRVQLRSDTGSVPLTFMAGDDSWSFREWDKTDGYGKSTFDNEQAFSFMMDKLHHFEPHVYIRSYSFLSFPAYRVFVPDISTTNLPLGPKRLQYKIEKESVNLLNQYPAVRLNANVLNQCFDYLTSEDNLLIDPFDDIPLEAVQAVFYYCYGHTQKAIDALRCLSEKQFVKKYRCAVMELELQSIGMDTAARDQMLNLFFDDKSIKFAQQAFRKKENRTDHSYLIDRVMDPMGKKLFSTAKGPDIQARARMHAVMRQKMRENLPDQAEIGKLFESSQE